MSGKKNSTHGPFEEFCFTIVSIRRSKPLPLFCFAETQAGLTEAAETLKGCFLQPDNCESTGGCDYNDPNNKTAIICNCNQGLYLLYLLTYKTKWCYGEKRVQGRVCVRERERGERGRDIV